MSHCLVVGLILVSIQFNLTLLSPAFGKSPPDAQLKTALDSMLSDVESYARLERLVAGSILTGLGAAAGVGAILSAYSQDPVTRIGSARILAVTSGVWILNGVLTLTMTHDFVDLPERYRLLPEGTAKELEVKAQIGETYLAQLAAEARRQRFLRGGILIGIGALQTAWYFAANANDPTVPPIDNSSLLSSGIITTAVGLVVLLLHRKAEIHNRDYLQLKSPPEGVLSSLEWNVLPVPGGGLTQISLRF